MTMEAKIQELIDKCNNKMAENEEMRKEGESRKKAYNFDLDTEKYSMKLENAKIGDFKPEFAEDADAVVTTTPEYFEQLLSGDLRPMRAYITKKITIKGKIQDLMFLKKFF